MTPYRISLTHVSSKKTVEFDDEGSEESFFFLWTEGNYSCDCNRDLFFHRVSQPDYYEDHPCGDSEYRLNWVRDLSTGEVLYPEMNQGGNAD
jgi:hypothetical protein